MLVNKKVRQIFVLPMGIKPKCTMIQIYNYNIFPNDIDNMFRGGVH